VSWGRTKDIGRLEMEMPFPDKISERLLSFPFCLLFYHLAPLCMKGTPSLNEKATFSIQRWEREREKVGREDER
jgi:hypothetical protein